MPSAMHCGRHHQYRCSECELEHNDDYHGDGKNDKQIAEEMLRVKSLKEFEKWANIHFLVISDVARNACKSTWLAQQEKINQQEKEIRDLKEIIKEFKWGADRITRLDSSDDFFQGKRNLKNALGMIKQLENR